MISYENKDPGTLNQLVLLKMPWKIRTEGVGSCHCLMYPHHPGPLEGWDGPLSRAAPAATLTGSTGSMCKRKSGGSSGVWLVTNLGFFTPYKQASKWCNLHEGWQKATYFLYRIIPIGSMGRNGIFNFHQRSAWIRWLFDAFFRYGLGSHGMDETHHEKAQQIWENYVLSFCNHRRSKSKQNDFDYPPWN